ncbi:uncharacterized protein LOC108627876 [Ceratina calcarata]|uniref:Uncharacterized protein LOC108627876 n=1 Tax=Ceratina calcarata TaxID=156304 RepID=A0AAJ7J514_9HYME|nr:uncharacterized protein LOC108627876 [Ceratina calcarata]XP_017884941.1 uncharacterized protein LOC108627876 [Ceratina calcarata]
MRMQSCWNIVSLFLVLIIFGDAIVHGEPEPMARPTRPEGFAIAMPDELIKYVDQFSNDLSLKAKQRYGKRGNALDISHAWNTIKAMYDNSRLAQTRFGKREQEESRFFFDPENYNGKQDASRLNDRPCIC